MLVAREPLPVRAAPETVLQVLGNLLDNAAKYAPGHGPVRLEATRFELRLPLAEPTSRPPRLGGRPSMPGAHAPGWLEVQHT